MGTDRENLVKEQLTLLAAHFSFKKNLEQVTDPKLKARLGKDFLTAVTLANRTSARALVAAEVLEGMHDRTVRRIEEDQAMRELAKRGMTEQDLQKNLPTDMDGVFDLLKTPAFN